MNDTHTLIASFFRSLHIAARNKQNYALKTLLTSIEHETIERRNEILNARNKRGQTALHSAIRASDADAVHYLITAGAQRSILDHDGNSVIDNSQSLYTVFLLICPSGELRFNIPSRGEA